MKVFVITIFILFGFNQTTLKAQETTNSFNQQGFNETPEPVETTPCREVHDSNGHLIIPLKGFALIYFFSERKSDSLKLRELLEQVKLKQTMPFFCINIDVNKDMMKALNVVDVPSIVILQHRRIIFATVGFTKNTAILTDILNNGIDNNLLIEQRNQ